MRIDHVIYATGELDAAAARVESEIGLTAVVGGRHEGHGTHNRILPLGGGYLELMAVADADEAADSPIGSALQARLGEHGDGLFAWAVAVEDVARIADSLDLPITTVSRQGMTARLVGVEQALPDPVLPFFIERDEGIRDPGDGGEAGGITWVEVAGDSGALERRLGGAELPVRVVEGPVGVVAMGIGDRELRNP
ncbi:MAG TPA: VOC family protein [Solirubrobacterales bacterium]|nr:VOC family protein [Solirubrobacterales bacterium]